jgi:hypothetical protein
MRISKPARVTRDEVSGFINRPTNASSSMYSPQASPWRQGNRIWVVIRPSELIAWFERVLPRLLQALERGETLIEII